MSRSYLCALPSIFYIVKSRGFACARRGSGSQGLVFYRVCGSGAEAAFRPAKHMKNLRFFKVSFLGPREFHFFPMEVPGVTPGASGVAASPPRRSPGASSALPGTPSGRPRAPLARPGAPLALPGGAPGRPGRVLGHPGRALGASPDARGASRATPVVPCGRPRAPLVRPWGVVAVPGRPGARPGPPVAPPGPPCASLSLSLYLSLSLSLSGGVPVRKRVRVGERVGEDNVSCRLGRPRGVWVCGCLGGLVAETL